MAIFGGTAAGRHAALAVGQIAHRPDRRARRCGVADMRHLDALHPHIEEPQNKGRVEARRAHDRRDPDPLGRHHHRLHVVQVEARMLHVDKGGVKAGKPDDLDDLRVGDAADMGPERQPALAQDALYPVFLSWRPPPLPDPVAGQAARAGCRRCSRSTIISVSITSPKIL